MTWRQRARVLLRMPVLIVATGLSGLLLLPAVPLEWLWPTGRARWINLIFRNWSRLFLALLRVRVHQQGAPPRAPFFLVSNHLSYMDIPLLASRADAAFIAKAEISGWPIFGPICRLAGTVFVDRTLKRDIPRVLRKIDKRLAHRQGVVLFWWGDMALGSHFVGLLAMPRFEAWLTFGAEPITDDDRKRLAQRLHGAVTTQFRPTVALEEI